MYLTPWSRVVEKLIVLLLVNKFPGFFMDARKVKGKLPPLHSVKAYRRSRVIAPLVLKLGNKWKFVVNCTPWSLYPWERTPVPML